METVSGLKARISRSSEILLLGLNPDWGVGVERGKQNKKTMPLVGFVLFFVPFKRKTGQEDGLNLHLELMSYHDY